MNTQTDARLIDIADVLKGEFDDVSLRGSGAAAFVFVQVNARAVEASIDNNRIWVEFWDSLAEDEPVSPVKDATLETVEEAEAEIRKWLTTSLE